jgi:hypothetical protein
MAVAKQTIANFIEKASRLYEQERSAVSAAAALEIYFRRWLRWAEGVFGNTAIADTRKTATMRTVPSALGSGRRSCIFT